MLGEDKRRDLRQDVEFSYEGFSRLIFIIVGFWALVGGVVYWLW